MNGPEERVYLDRVLLATDFSGCSQAAQSYAVSIANKYGSQLLVAHVVSHQPAARHGSQREMFTEAAGQRSGVTERDFAAQLPECSHEVLIRRGEVWAELAAVIESRRIEMVVLGTRGQGNARKLELGSTAQQALRHAPCPVLTVGPDASADLMSQPEIREVLCLTELEPGSPAAAAYAVSLASEYRAHLSVLHATPKRNGTPPELLTQRFCGSISCAGLLHRPTAFVKYGRPVERILEAEHERGADLIVLGAQRVDRLTDRRAGLALSGVERLAAKAHCPVLTIAS